MAAVQLEMEKRKDYMKGHGTRQQDIIKIEDNPFSGRVICGHCGSAFGRKTWNSTEKKLNEIIKKGEIDEFNIDLYFRTIEKMVAFEDKIIVGRLYGTEIECINE